VTAVPLTDIAPLRPVLAIRPLGVFSDIDGTLSPIVERPEGAYMAPGCGRMLRLLVNEGVRVALITGRALEVARSMANLDGAAYAGSHGLEFWVDGVIDAIDAAAYAALVDRVIADTGHLRVFDVAIENKGVGVAFHYRQSGLGDAARLEIERALNSSEAAQRFQRIEGRKVIELRPDVDASKGTATTRLAHRLGVRSIISVGDDQTDVQMFRAVASLTSEGVEGRSVAVLSPEIHPDVLAGADYSVNGVDGVEWLLGELLRAVRQTAG
jgi:trehalose-phosphatase